MNTVRSSHLALKKQQVNDKRILEKDNIVRFDDFVNFARTHRQELRCKNPPCLLPDDYVHSLTYLLVKNIKEDSPIMRELYWFVHSDKPDIMHADVHEKQDVDDELTYTPYVGVYRVSEEVETKYPDTSPYMMSAIQPLKTFVDILPALKRR